MQEGELGWADREEKREESIRRLIDVVHADQTISPEETVIEELQEFPYLQELISSLLFRISLAQERDLQKNLQIDMLHAQLHQARGSQRGSNAETSKDEEIRRLRDENEGLRMLRSELEEQLEEERVESDRYKVDLERAEERMREMEEAEEGKEAQRMRKLEEERKHPLAE